VFATGLTSPTGLYFSGDGNLYVSNSGTGVVEMYAPDGTDLGAFSTSPVGTPAYMIARPQTIQFQNEPASLRLLTGGTANFTAQATGSNLTYQWLKDGQPLSNDAHTTGAASPTLTITRVTGADAGGYDVAVSACGSPLPSLVVPLVVVAAPTTNSVLLVSYSNTNTIEEFSEGEDLGIFPAEGLSSPAGLAVDGKGNVYVVNTTANTFDKFSATGELLFSIPTGAGPLGLAQDGAGHFYVANSGSNTVERYSPTGSDEGVFVHTQASPWGVVVNSLGEVYVSESAGSGGFGWGGGVVVLDDTGTSTGSVYSSGGSLNLGGGGGGASNSGMDAVEQFSTKGAKLRTFTSGNLSQPAGLAVDAVGNVFVANQGSDSVEKFSPKGVDLGKAPLAGIGQPTGLLLVDGGVLFVAGNAVNEIRQISQKTGEDSGPYVSTGMGLPVMMVGRAGVAKISREPPVSLSMLGGKTTTLTASATGIGLVYQWQKNGVNLTNGGRISGATTASLRIQGVTAADAGQYQLVISSAGGPAMVMVTLTVRGIPMFVQQPATTSVATGSNFMLTAKATGVSPLAYQWYKNGTKLRNGGTHLLKVTSPQIVVKKSVLGDAGIYTVTASNPAGSATSGAAMVTVNPAN
jgi:sugar lactone lactonase YvrE